MQQRALGIPSLFHMYRSHSTLTLKHRTHLRFRLFPVKKINLSKEIIFEIFFSNFSC